MTLSIKRIVSCILSAILLYGAGFCLYTVNKDIFFGLGWFLLFAALVSPIAERLLRASSRLFFYLAVLLIGIVWFFVNDSLFFLISTSVNSNPYGDYLFDQFEFRLTLSIFVLKTIVETWLTDIRLLYAGLLLSANAFLFPPLFKRLFLFLPARYFEFFVTTFLQIKIEFRRYLADSLILAMIHGGLWCLAGFLLQFDNFILMACLMILCAFFPRIGLFAAALFSLFFVERGLFLVQLGGMLIAVASIWFVDHTALQERPRRITKLPTILLIAMACFGYVVFSFLGLFLSIPLVTLSAIISQQIVANMTLMHKIPHSQPRTA